MHETTSPQQRVRTWLQSDDAPGDMYALLGSELLDPRRELLLQAARDTHRALSAYQNHKDPGLRKRALKLRAQVAGASRILSDAAALQRYESELQQDLYEQYLELNGGSTRRWRPENIRRWLLATRHVHAARVDELASVMLEQTAAEDADKRSPQRSREPNMFELLADSVDLGRPPATVSPGRPTPTQSAPSLDKKQETAVAGTAVQSPDDSPIVEDDSSSASAPANAPIRPPRPPASRHRLKSSQQVSPSQSSGRSRRQATTVRRTPASRRTSVPRHARGMGARSGKQHLGILWIVGSAVTAMLVVGLLGALIILIRLSPRERAAADERPPASAADGNRAGTSPFPPPSAEPSEPAGESAAADVDSTGPEQNLETR